jgi:hypothetical protein
MANPPTWQSGTSVYSEEKTPQIQRGSQFSAQQKIAVDGSPELSEAVLFQ